jgi:hypothetical protein
VKILEFRKIIGEEVRKVLKESKEFKNFLKAIEMKNLKRGHLIQDLRTLIPNGFEGHEDPEYSGNPGQVVFFFISKSKMLLAYNLIKKRYPNFKYEAVQLINKNDPNGKLFRLAVVDGGTAKPQNGYKNVPIALL